VYDNIAPSPKRLWRVADFLERFWRSVKYEEVYLKDYADAAEARRGLEEYFQFYNHERLHQALDYRTPAEVYEGVAGGRMGTEVCPVARTGRPTGSLRSSNRRRVRLSYSTPFAVQTMGSTSAFMVVAAAILLRGMEQDEGELMQVMRALEMCEDEALGEEELDDKGLPDDLEDMFGE